MKYFKLILSTMLAVSGASSALAAVTCKLVISAVQSYEHGGVYVSGTLSNVDGTSARGIGYMTLCGGSGASQGTGAVQNCDSRATDRSYALAMSAQAQRLPLYLYWNDLATCDAVVNYSRPFGIWIQP